jgi:hypothetical protein
LFSQQQKTDTKVGTIGDGDLYKVPPKPTSGEDRIQEERDAGHTYRLRQEDEMMERPINCAKKMISCRDLTNAPR